MFERVALVMGIIALLVQLFGGFRFMLNEWRNWRNKGKWLVLIGLFQTIIVLPMIAQSANCSGASPAWSCTSANTMAEMQSTITASSDGDTITFATGTYDWSTSTQLKFSNSKGVSLQCATPPSGKGSATTNQCLFTRADRTVFGTDLITGTNTKAYRISGFTFDLNGQSSNLGAVYFDSYNGGTNSGTMNNVRVDHNTFQNSAAGGTYILTGSLGAPKQQFNFHGVIDHNLFLSTVGQVLALKWLGEGDRPFANSLGTAENAFFEDNILDYTIMGSASVGGCIDGWGGGALVARYNISLNCIWTSHGVQHDGGTPNFEFYNNQVSVDNNADVGFTGCYRCVHHQGSGTSMFFNNVFTATGTKTVTAMSMLHYRSFTDLAISPLFLCDGTHVEDGNRTPLANYRGYPCYHQPGRDYAGTLQPIYSWNNYWSDTLAIAGWNWENFGGTAPVYYTEHTQADRDYYKAISKDAQTSSSAPFNGTTGMGFGTHLSPDYRPTTCTATADPLDAGNGGVGYFATDENILYWCTSTNTWTAHYTPYTYPHPLNVSENIPTTTVVIARVIRWMEVAAFVTGMGWHFRRPLMSVILAVIAGCGTLYQLVPQSYETVKVVSKESAVKVLTVFNHFAKPRN